jgi:DNA-binding CsgD family transcriptional regulator
MARDGLELAQQRDVDVARAEYLLGTAYAIFAEPGAEEHLGRAIEAARAEDDTSTEFLAVVNLVSTHEMAGDPAEGRRLCERYIQRARELGLGDWEQHFRLALASLDFHAGHYERMLGESEHLLTQNLDKRGVGQLIEMYCVALIDTGRHDEALRRLAVAEPELVSDVRGRFEALWVRVEAALWGGRPEEAAQLAEQYLNFHDQDSNRFFGAPALAWARYDLGVEPGEPPEVDDIPILQAIPDEVRAVAALQRGDARRAVELFDRAAQLWAPYHRRGELRCRWGAGEAARQVDGADGVQRLEEVEARAVELGLLPLLARVHRSLRAAGQRRSAPRTRSAGSTLTGRQREVLGLVAEGLTNAQIAQRLGISRHTVVTQLASASAKLGATNRAHAASLAAAQP